MGKHKGRREQRAKGRGADRAGRYGGEVVEVERHVIAERVAVVFVGRRRVEGHAVACLGAAMTGRLEELFRLLVDEVQVDNAADPIPA